MIEDDPEALIVRSKSERRRLQRRPWLRETPEQTRARRTALVKNLALELGFSRVGIAAAVPLPGDQLRLQAWLDAGHHAGMAWLAQETTRRCDPGLVVDGAKSVIVLAVDYDTAHPRTAAVRLAGEDRAWISRFAWGTDYHLVLHRRLRRLEEALTHAWRPELAADFRGPGVRPGPLRGVRDLRFYVDHGPVLERTWAVRAGLGWRGKHSLVIHPQHGSFFFLSCMVTSVELEPDSPMTDRCGTCRACIDACPTHAIREPFVVDARRCISHMTIEQDGRIPQQERALVGDHVFGCDLCQDACPWNRFAKPCGQAEFEPRPGLFAPQLAHLDALDEADFTAHFSQSPLKRRGREGLRDNIAAVREGRERSTHGNQATEGGSEHPESRQPCRGQSEAGSHPGTDGANRGLCKCKAGRLKLQQDIDDGSRD